MPQIAMPRQGALPPGKYRGIPPAQHMLVEDSGHIMWVLDKEPACRGQCNHPWEFIHNTWGPFYRMNPETMEF